MDKIAGLLWIGVALAAFWGMVGWLAMAHGTQLNWPDFVHVNYGFPYTFAVHTLNTIAGPVDKWDVDSAALALDAALWLGGSVAVAVGLAYLSRRAGR